VRVSAVYLPCTQQGDGLLVVQCCDTVGSIDQPVPLLAQALQIAAEGEFGLQGRRVVESLEVLGKTAPPCVGEAYLLRFLQLFGARIDLVLEV
ncbi:MAG: hypothetical protein RR326_14815, partial [Stenotrophomonas sp.]